MELSAYKAGLITDFERLEDHTFNEILGAVIAEDEIRRSRPDGICRLDPRSAVRIIYSSNRAHRPHDHRPAGAEEAAASAPACPICTAHTTRILDKAPLSQGFTFINKNLYPILYPDMKVDPGFQFLDPRPAPDGTPAYGIHFLQWMSNVHDRDLHNMPEADIAVILERLSVLEAKCLHADIKNFPFTANLERPSHTGYIGVIKNFGRLVGSSLSHGHNQVAFTNVMPKAVADNIRFERRNNISFVRHLADQTPRELLLEENDHFTAMVPYFMTRPLHAVVVNRRSERYFHDIEHDHLIQLAVLLRKTIISVMHIMEQSGREPAYNVLFHSGPGSEFYLEILPFTQEIGGYEQLGLYVCHGTPEATARLYRDAGEF